jgi:hypothetical protein
VTFFPPMPDVPSDLPVQAQLWLRYQLFRVRVAFVKEDHAGLYAALDRIGEAGFPQVKQAIIDTLKLRLFRQLALESMPWTNEGMHLHTMN